jgi:hypothetical protein
MGFVLLRIGMLFASASPHADSDLSGAWTWKWKDAQNEIHRHVLEIESARDKLAARERYDDMDPVKVTDLKVDGKRVTFSVLRDKRRSAYSGTLDKFDTINGKVVVTVEGGDSNEFGWTATKESKP